MEMLGPGRFRRFYFAEDRDEQGQRGQKEKEREREREREEGGGRSREKEIEDLSSSIREGEPSKGKGGEPLQKKKHICRVHIVPNTLQMRYTF